MYKSAVFILIAVFFSCNRLYAQSGIQRLQLGFNYGLGRELKNKDFRHTNSFYKLQLCYELKEGRSFKYELLVQPEFNNATHQLINVYFIKDDDPNYVEKRQKFSTLRNVNEYVLNMGFLIRKPISTSFSIYLLGSVGPMIITNETERLTGGFAFADVLALGFSLRVGRIQLEVRPNIRHVSNAGFQSPNLGFNTFNMEFGSSFTL